MTKILKIKRVMPDEKAALLKTQFLDESYIKHPIVTEDTDAYDLNGNMLFRFRKNVIPLDILQQGVDNFKYSIEKTDGRGATSGSSHKRIRKDGSVSKITVGNKVLSGNVGFMDSNAMVSYCRMTAFGRNHFEKFQQGIPFVKKIDELYKELCPAHYAIQKMYAEATNQSYVIDDTVFTTVTVNQDFRTACHQDSGDLAEGFGNLIAYREGDWSGCYFTLPEFGVGIDLRNGDCLFVDVHKWHGNTEFINFNPEKGDKRISFVLYYRENMISCKSPSEELKTIKKEKNGFYRL